MTLLAAGFLENSVFTVTVLMISLVGIKLLGGGTGDRGEILSRLFLAVVLPSAAKLVAVILLIWSVGGGDGGEVGLGHVNAALTPPHFSTSALLVLSSQAAMLTTVCERFLGVEGRGRSVGIISLVLGCMVRAVLGYILGVEGLGSRGCSRVFFLAEVGINEMMYCI